MASEGSITEDIILRKKQSLHGALENVLNKRFVRHLFCLHIDSRWTCQLKFIQKWNIEDNEKCKML
jgi:hypothetical protein